MLIREASSACRPSMPNCLLGGPRILPAQRIPSDQDSISATFFQQFLGPFFYRFLDQFGLQNGPQNGSKIRPKSEKFGVHFFTVFFRDVGALWVPLGSLLVLSKVLLGGLWTPKTLKNQ